MNGGVQNHCVVGIMNVEMATNKWDQESAQLQIQLTQISVEIVGGAKKFIAAGLVIL